MIQLTGARGSSMGVLHTIPVLCLAGAFLEESRASERTCESTVNQRGRRRNKRIVLTTMRSNRTGAWP